MKDVCTGGVLGVRGTVTEEGDKCYPTEAQEGVGRRKELRMKQVVRKFQEP
jgi:hypothetical protein